MANEFGKGIPLSTSFDLGSRLPLDSRSIVETKEDLKELKNNSLVCDGLSVFVRNGELDNNNNSAGILYQYTGSYTAHYENDEDEGRIDNEWTEISSYPKVKSLVNITADEIRIELADKEANLYTKLEMIASQIRSEVADMGEQLSSKITQTAGEIRSEVADMEDQIYSYISQTAGEIRHEVTNINNKISSHIIQTSDEIRSEVIDGDNQLSSTLSQTASEIRSELTDAKNNLSSSIIQTATEIRSEVRDADNNLSSLISQTATEIRSEVKDLDNKLTSNISQTAGEIRSEVKAEDNKLSSLISQTAAAIRSEVTDSDNKLSSKITQTAGEIRSEVKAADDKLTSNISQTATAIRAEISDLNNNLTSKINQTASSITSEVSNLENNLNSKITQTAESLTAKFNDGYSQGVTTINKDGIKVSQSNYSGYTQMRADGFYVNNGTENVVSITKNGAVFKGTMNMTGGSITGTTIDGGLIKTGTVDADRIKANSITANQIAANAITASELNASAVTTDKIAANAINASKIAANTITADQIAANAITASELAANAVTAGKISAGAITADKIAANAITSDKISANAINGKNITGGTITGSKIIGQGNGNRILINNSDYEIQDGTITKGFFGLRTLDDGFDTARLALSSTGLNKFEDNYLVIVPYNGNGYNPQSYQYPYVDIAYRCPQFVDPRVGHADCSNVKMYADGDIRISAIRDLIISTNFSKGAYKSSGEGRVAEFRSYNHDCFDYCLDVRALRNDMNNNGLVFSYQRTDSITNEFVARMMVYNDGFRTFAPYKPTSDGIPHHLGSGSYRWQTVYAVNSLNTSSDITLKENIKYLSETPNTKAARSTELSTQDLYDFVRDDLFLTSYNWKSDEKKDEKLGFIAQDIVDTKVGEKVIVCNRDSDDTLGYDSGNFEAVIAGALQVAIKKIEQLEARIEELENK